ncbi:MAG: WYL domain-containing protein [Lachnospiraceae bacterium]|nr:WYL domain-containing protein [Lachnospiraceae bacterium]
MSFYINYEQKVRISLSERARLILAEDMESFGFSRGSSFINHVFKNFRDEAKASLSMYLKERRVEIERSLLDVSLEDDDRTIVINSLLLDEKTRLINEIEKLKDQKGESKIYHINDDNYDYLTEECDEDDFYFGPGIYMKAVIEEYAKLPYIRREKIVRKDVFEKVERACKEHTLLKVKTSVSGQDKLFYVYPYKIVPDSLHTMYYLVCYSRAPEESDSEKIVVSFNMARINPTCMKKSFFLNKKEVSNIESQLTMYSAMYLVGKPERIEIKLSDKGKKLYQSKLFSRPEKINDLSDNEKYVFECTPRQIFNYFFSFGSEVEVLSPQSLRVEFASKYSKALEHYGDCDV